jgi:hypothetical protein
MTIITPDDHSTYIWLATLHSLSYALCFLGFRILVKRERYSVDDLILGVGYVSKRLIRTPASYDGRRNTNLKSTIALCPGTLDLLFCCSETRTRKVNEDNRIFTA